MKRSGSSSPRFRFLGSALILVAPAFLIAALREGDQRLWLLTAAVSGFLLLGSVVFARMFSLDRLILTLTLYLCSAGILAPALSDPSAAFTQSLYCLAGFFVLLSGAVAARSLSPSMLTSLSAGFIGLLLLAGKTVSAAFSLPVEEAALALLLLCFSSLLSREGVFIALIPGAVGLGLLLVRHDPVSAGIWGLTMLALLWAADGRLLPVCAGAAALLLMFFCASRLLPEMLSPISAETSGSVSALVSAGWVGADVLPVGIPPSAPLFSLLAGHYGLLFSLLTVLLFLPLLLRGASVAGASRTRFHAVLAMGCTLLLALRTMAGLLTSFGILPLPVSPLPLLSRSLPELCADFFLAGLLCGISGRNDADLEDDAHLAMLSR